MSDAGDSADANDEHEQDRIAKMQSPPFGDAASLVPSEREPEEDNWLCRVCVDTGKKFFSPHGDPMRRINVLCEECPTCDNLNCSEPLRLRGGLHLLFLWQDGYAERWCSTECFEKSFTNVRRQASAYTSAAVFVDFAIRCGHREDAAETLQDIAKLAHKTLGDWINESRTPHGLEKP